VRAVRLLDGAHVLDQERRGAVPLLRVPERPEARHTCPSKSVPAGEIERLVVEQIRAIGQNPELLSAEMFVDLRDAKAHAARWKNDSNHRRPHSSLGYQTPAAFAVSLSRPPVGAAPRPPADSANPCSPVPTLITAGT